MAVGTDVITFQPPFRAYFSAPARLGIADVVSAGVATRRRAAASGVELLLRDGATVYFWPYDLRWRSDATDPSPKVSRLLAALENAGVAIQPGEHAVGWFARRCRSPLVAPAKLRPGVVVACVVLFVVFAVVTLAEAFR